MITRGGRLLYHTDLRLAQCGHMQFIKMGGEGEDKQLYSEYTEGTIDQRTIKAKLVTLKYLRILEVILHTHRSSASCFVSSRRFPCCAVLCCAVSVRHARWSWTYVLCSQTGVSVMSTAESNKYAVIHWYFCILLYTREENTACWCSWYSMLFDNSIWRDLYRLDQHVGC